MDGDLAEAPHEIRRSARHGSTPLVSWRVQNNPFWHEHEATEVAVS
jgi:hypothetical protein